MEIHQRYSRPNVHFHTFISTQMTQAGQLVIIFQMFTQWTYCIETNMHVCSFIMTSNYKLYFAIVNYIIRSEAYNGIMYVW